MPNPYRNLNFSGFAVGAASPVSVVALRPSSLQNFATAPGTFSLLSPVLISTAGTKTKAFDLNALNIGCYAALRNGAAAPPLDCEHVSKRLHGCELTSLGTLNLNATKAGTGQKVSTTIGFRTGGPLGVSTKSMAVKPVKLPDSFKLLSQVQLTIASSAAPNVAGASVQFAIDDVKNVVHILK